MFSKFKSLFADKNNPEVASSDFIHPNTQNGDVSQCPFMSKQKNNGNKDQDAKNVNKKKSKDQSDTESEPEQKPRGGCPFMASSGTKKNPNLGIQHEGFDEPFVSKYKYYLSANKINFDLMKNGKQQSPTIRHKFDQYPIYLKHTLFYNGDDYKKVRSLQCCSRFLAYEELRQKGNKNYNKGKYLNAIDYYERAMSLFRWLDHQEPEVESSISGSQLMIEDGTSQSQISDSQSMSKIPIRLGKDQERNNFMKEEKDAEFDEFRQKYKQFFIVYHDDNVVSNDGQEMTESVDTDMRRSLLIQIYLNMAAAYIKLNNYSLASRVLQDAMSLSDKVSQTYLRKAQVCLSNKSSSLQELREGLANIKRAVEMQPNQKIFQNTNINILKMVNIHDAKQVYASVMHKLEQRVAAQEKKLNQLTQSIQNRLAQINQIQQQIIRQGKQPREGGNSRLLSEGTDYKILRRIYDKYVRILQFYTQAKDKTQISLAKKQFQQILRTFSEIKLIESVEINIQDSRFGNNQEKIKNRIKNIKRQKCQQIYNSTKYNFQVLQWAIKQIVKQQHEEKEKRKKQEQQQQNTKCQNQSTQGKQKSFLLGKLTYAMILLPIIGIALNYLI